MWSNSSYIVDKKFEVYLKKLKEYNIYFDDPKIAAKYLNFNYNKHIKLWYENKEIKTLLSEIRNQYAKTTLNPQASFINTIQQYLDVK